MTSIEQICKNMPTEFIKYNFLIRILKYIRKLELDELPNYAKIDLMFIDI